MNRRRVLSSVTALGAIAVAGCTGREQDGSDGGTDGETTDGGMGGETTDGGMGGETTDGGMGGETTDGGMDAEVGATVDMVNRNFDPVEASIDPGQAVEWVNQDGFEHDVTARTFNDGATDWDFAKSVAAGESVTHTFESAGVYEYVCTIHGKSSMCGVVLVGGVSPAGSLPCQSGGNGGGNGGGGNNPYDADGAV